MEVIEFNRTRQLIAENGDIINPGDIVWCGQWYGPLFYYAWRVVRGAYAYEADLQEQMFVSPAITRDLQTMWRRSTGYWISIQWLQRKYDEHFIRELFETKLNDSLTALERATRAGPKNIYIDEGGRDI